MAEYPGFDQDDRARLSELQKVANTMQDEALQNPKLKRWKEFLFLCAVCTIVSIFLMPAGRVNNWLSYLFPFLCVGTALLLLFVFRWANELRHGAEDEFLERYGKEYNQLHERRVESEAWFREEEARKKYTGKLR